MNRWWWVAVMLAVGGAMVLFLVFASPGSPKRDPAQAVTEEWVAVVWVGIESSSGEEAVFGTRRRLPVDQPVRTQAPVPVVQITEPEAKICNPALVATASSFFLTWQSEVGGVSALRGVRLSSSLETEGDIIDILPEETTEIEAFPWNDSADDIENYLPSGSCSVFDPYDMTYCPGNNTVYLVWTSSWEAFDDPGRPRGFVILRSIELARRPLLAPIEQHGWGATGGPYASPRIAASPTCDLLAMVVRTPNESVLGYSVIDKLFSSSDGIWTSPAFVPPSLPPPNLYRRAEVAYDSLGDRFLAVWDAYDQVSGTGAIHGRFWNSGQAAPDSEFMDLAEYTADESSLEYRLPLSATTFGKGLFVLAYHNTVGGRPVLETVTAMPDGTVGTAVRRKRSFELSRMVRPLSCVGAGEVASVPGGTINIAYEYGICHAGSADLMSSDELFVASYGE